MARKPESREMRPGALLPCLIGLLLAVPAVLQAQQTAHEEPGALRIAVAYFDVDGGNDVTAVELTYQLENLRFWHVRPQVGAMANLDGGMYAYGGFILPVELPGRFRVSPSLGAGAYHQGDSLDLGSVLEFRSAIQLDRPIRGDDRLALFLYHLSNASLGDRNPGTEVLGLGYVFRW